MRCAFGRCVPQWPRHTGGSGLGDAVEAKNQTGVGFFSQKGDLLAVEFDDVAKEKDHQILKFGTGEQIEIFVSSGKVSWSKTGTAGKTSKASRKKVVA